MLTSRRLAGSRRERRSLSGRLSLIVLMTTSIALVVAGAALLYTDLREGREAGAEDLATQAAILALATAPALSFQDQTGAMRNLAALEAKPTIRAAALYAVDGSLYADYVRGGAKRAPTQLPPLAPGIHIDGERVELIRPVVQSGETLGTIYLRAQYPFGERVIAYASIVAIVMVLSLGVALLAAARLQRAITQPMNSMAGVAQGLIERRDYSLRAQKTADDEIGLVVDAFNSMLDEVQARARALEESNAALSEQAQVRLAAEQALRQSERLYRGIGESIDYGVWVCDAEGRNIYASDSFLRLTGLTQEECSEFRWGRLLHPEDREATIAAWKECVRKGVNWYREHRILGTDGQYHFILAQGVPIRDEEGRIQQWAGINLDISRLKRTEHALREADRRKDEFLATLAHELRNPLAPIQNAVRILDLPTSDERQRRWGREVIARQVRHMALLLDDLLDVSRITRGQLELKKDYVDLADIIEVALETARPLIEAKQHTLAVSRPPQAVRLEADPLRLSQVIANLLTNAAKYTDRGGRIGVTCTVSDTGLTIAVRDTGIGIAREAIPRLFTIFSQVSSALDRSEGGLGIGLSLVKGLVELHGGTVEARSEGLGRGSEFLVHLPAYILVRPERAAAGMGSRDVKPLVKAIGTVLVADDNRDAAETLAAVLRFSGYEVVTATSGAEAIEVGARERPRAVLLDIGMPGMSGYETARRIRHEAWGRRAVLVAVTGWGQEDDKQKARAAGFDAHLTKPVDPMHVEQILSVLLGRERLAGERPPEDAARGDA